MFPRPFKTPSHGLYSTFLFAAGLLLCCAAAISGAEAAGVPALSVEPQSLDFGTMEQHEAKQSFLTLTNTGSAELNITKVHSTCGCTVATPAKNVLMPGESTRVDVTFNSENYQGDQIKYITIASNDPALTKKEIMIRAHIHVPLLAFPPKGLRFESVRAGDSTSLGLQLSSEDVAKLEIKPVRWNKDLFDVKVYPDYHDKPNQVGVFFSIKEGAPQGSFEEIVRLESNVPGQPFLDYDIKGRVVADIVIEPERVNFRYAAKNRAMNKVIRVSAPAKNIEFNVTGAEIDLPGFKVTAIKPNPKTKVVELFISGYPLPDDDPRVIEAKGRMQGTLLISTDHPQYPELSVKVLYLIKL